MNKAVLNLGFLGLVLASSIAAPLHIWHQGELQRSAMTQEAERQAARLKALAAENERLTLAAQNAPDSLAPEQLRELLRLRGEIGMLRDSVAALDKLQAANERIRARLTKSTTPMPPADMQKVVADWPKTQLAMAGYADPTSAVETTLWAMTRNDPVALAASVTPEATTKLTKAQWNDHGSSDAEMAKSTQKIADSLSSDAEFYVLGQQSEKEDEAQVEVYFAGENQSRKFLMQRIADAWKFASLGGIWP